MTEIEQFLQDIRAEARAEGRAEVLIEMVKKLINDNKSPEFIKKITGIDLQQLEAIKATI